MKIPKPPSPPKFGPKRINPGTGRLTSFGGSKGSKMLPGRHALNELSKGNPAERSFANFAKLTPSGAGAPMTYQGIMDMGLNAPSLAAGPASDDELPPGG